MVIYHDNMSIKQPIYWNAYNLHNIAYMFKLLYLRLTIIET